MRVPGIAHRLLGSTPPRLTLFGLTLAAACGGCIPWLGFITVHTEDISVVKVDLIGKFEGVDYYTGPGGQQLSFQRYLIDHPDEKLLRITLSTATDLAGIAADDALSIFLNASECPLGIGPELGRAGDLYEQHEGTPVIIAILSRTYREHPERRPVASASGKYLYDAYAITYRRPGPPVVDDLPAAARMPYDLLKNPQDICIQVAGGREDGVSLRSNIVTISRRTIEEATRMQAGLPPPAPGQPKE